MKNQPLGFLTPETKKTQIKLLDTLKVTKLPFLGVY
jgi:hypothetical protein